MTVGSKLNVYGYESNGGLHCELYQNDGPQMLTISIHTVTTDWSTEYMQFHRVPYLGDVVFLIYNRQFIVNIDTLIF